MRKLFRKIHLWLSVPFGLIIALICFSGAMLVFENEVNELTRPELYRVTKSDTEPLSIEQLLEKVAATLPDSVSVTGVTISSDPQRPYQVNLSKPRRAFMIIDQYTGEIKGKSGRTGFFMTMFRLHRWLLDSMNPGNEGVFWGKMIVGVSTLLFVFVLISGIIVWWPRTRKALKNSLKISATKGWRRFWYDLHVAGGMYALVFLLVMALTGLTWSFPWYQTAFYNVFGVEMKQNATQAHGGGAQVAKDNSKGERNKNRRGEDASTRKKVAKLTKAVFILIGRKYMNSSVCKIPNISKSVFLRVREAEPQQAFLSIASAISVLQTVILLIRATVKSPKPACISIKTNRIKFVAGFTPFM